MDTENPILIYGILILVVIIGFYLFQKVLGLLLLIIIVLIVIDFVNPNLLKTFKSKIITKFNLDENAKLIEIVHKYFGVIQSKITNFFKETNKSSTPVTNNSSSSIVNTENFKPPVNNIIDYNIDSIIDDTIEEISEDETTIDDIENTIIENKPIDNNSIENIDNVKLLNVDGYSSTSWGSPI